MAGACGTCWASQEATEHGTTEVSLHAARPAPRRALDGDRASKRTGSERAAGLNMGLNSGRGSLCYGSYVAVQNFGCWYVCAAEQERPEESLFALAESAHKHGSVHERVWRFI
jgi:hypothetical protein